MRNASSVRLGGCSAVGAIPTVRVEGMTSRTKSSREFPPGPSDGFSPSHDNAVELTLVHARLAIATLLRRPSRRTEALMPAAAADPLYTLSVPPGQSLGPTHPLASQSLNMPARSHVLTQRGSVSPLQRRRRGRDTRTGDLFQFRAGAASRASSRQRRRGLKVLSRSARLL